MSTDTGIDLVAYAPRSAQARTIQIKTNLGPKPGKAALDWWIRASVPAQIIALVDLSTMKVWLLLKEELPTLAQQQPSGRFHLYMVLEATRKPHKTGKLLNMSDFDTYLIETRAPDLF